MFKRPQAVLMALCLTFASFAHAEKDTPLVVPSNFYTTNKFEASSLWTDLSSLSAEALVDAHTALQIRSIALSAFIFTFETAKPIGEFNTFLAESQTLADLYTSIGVHPADGEIYTKGGLIAGEMMGLVAATVGTVELSKRTVFKILAANPAIAEYRKAKGALKTAQSNLATARANLAAAKQSVDKNLLRAVVDSSERAVTSAKAEVTKTFAKKPYWVTRAPKAWIRWGAALTLGSTVIVGLTGLTEGTLTAMMFPEIMDSDIDKWEAELDRVLDELAAIEKLMKEQGVSDYMDLK